MNSSRATPVMAALLFSVLASCGEQAAVPTEPSRVAPMPSIPGSSSVVVRTGKDAERFLEETAAAWARKGEVRLSQRLLEERELSSPAGEQRGRERAKLAPTMPGRALSPGETPTPTTVPNAVIYYSSTSPYVSGSSAPVVSSVTYFGNVAITTVTYEAQDASGVFLIPKSTTTNRGEGEQAPCLGSAWQCSWTFRLQTVVALNLGKDCGVTVAASANHTAQWTIPLTPKFPAATWGSAFAIDGRSVGSNGPCAPPPTCLQAGATNYGGPLPCTFPPPVPPTGGDGSTPPGTGTPTPPPTYSPGPTPPAGHWECYKTYLGTDYETERCTFYPDYTRIPKASPTLALSAAEGVARSLNGGNDPSVFVIVSDQVPADAMAIIERHKQGPFKNVLLVPSSTIRPAVFVAALQALADAREKHGESPAKEYQTVLEGSILDQQIPAAARDYAASFVALIANAKRGDAGAYGQRPIFEIKLADKK